jgi:hypothetical protein
MSDSFDVICCHNCGKPVCRPVSGYMAYCPHCTTLVAFPLCMSEKQEGKKMKTNRTVKPRG